MTTDAEKSRKRRRRGGNKKGAKQKKRPDDSTAPESSEDSEDEFPSTPPKLTAEAFKKTTPPPAPRKKGNKGKASKEPEVSLRSLGLFLFRMAQLVLQENIDAETRQFEFANACTKILGIDINDVNILAGAN